MVPYKVSFYPLRNQWAVEYAGKIKFFTNDSPYTRTVEVEDFIQKLLAKVA